MPFASNKTPEQLEQEKKDKMKAMTGKAAAYVGRVSKMRNKDPRWPVFKTRLSEIQTELSMLAEELGK